MTLASSLGTIIGQHVAWVHWPIQIVVAGLTAVWMSRTYWSERRYLVDTGVLPTLLKISAKTPAKAPVESVPDAGEVRFKPDDTVVSVEIGASLLEVAEREGRSIEAGCGWASAAPIRSPSSAEWNACRHRTRRSRTPCGDWVWRTRRGWRAAPGCRTAPSM